MSLSSAELAYIARVAGALTTGSDLGSNARGAGQNYLKLQDLVCILDILQSAMQPTSARTVVNGSTTTSIKITAVPVNAYVGATITFAAGTTTVALRGISRTVKSNNATDFVVDTLPGTPVTGDTFTLVGGPISGIITYLKGGKGRGDYFTNGVYGDNRVVSNALLMLLQTLAGSVVPSRQITRAGATTRAGSTDTIINTNDTYRPDEFNHKRIVISGQTRTIVSNGENFLVLNKALSSAPAAATAYAIHHDHLDVDQLGKQAVHPAGHAENAPIGALLTQLGVLVNAFVLPT